MSIITKMNKAFVAAAVALSGAANASPIYSVAAGSLSDFGNTSVGETIQLSSGLSAGDTLTLNLAGLCTDSGATQGFNVSYYGVSLGALGPLLSQSGTQTYGTVCSATSFTSTVLSDFIGNEIVFLINPTGSTGTVVSVNDGSSYANGSFVRLDGSTIAPISLYDASADISVTAETPSTVPEPSPLALLGAAALAGAVARRRMAPAKLAA